MVPIVLIVLFALLSVAPQNRADWPQWGGPQRDFAVGGPDVEPWAESGPAVLWRREIGSGFSTVVVGDGRLLTMYRDGDHEVIVAVATANGKPLWEQRYAAPLPADATPLDTSYGAGPNSTPLIAGPNVYTLGFTGILTCVRMRDGTRLWTRNLGDAGVSPPYFGHAASPVRFRDTVIVVAGGAHAFDLENGKPRWSNTSFDASYASPAVIERDARHVLVVPAAGEVAGLDPQDGKVLWRHEHANQHRTILSSPVFGDDDWAFVSAFYIGSIGLQLAENGGAVTRRWENRNLQLSHSNAVRDGDVVYGFHNSILTALDVKSGEIHWRHRGIRKANLLRVGKRFLLLDNLGKLYLASLTPARIEVLATAQVFEGRTWSAPTWSDGVLFVRTEDTLMALDLSGKRAKRPAPLQALAQPTPRRIVPPPGFMDAKRRLSAAIHAADAGALEAARNGFARWTAAGNDAAALAHYHAGLAAWQQALAVDPADALALIDVAVEQLERALKLNPDLADAHALLGPSYASYYRFDRGRAAVIGPKGDEHLAIALLKEPRNPRAVAAVAADLVNSPPEYGGDRPAGLARFRDALALFGNAPARDTTAEPDWGHAGTWVAYGRALLAGDAPDREGACDAFKQALAIEPRLVAAQLQLEQVGCTQATGPQGD